MNFLVRYGDVLGMKDASSELSFVRRFARNDFGLVGAIFAQHELGLPVDGATVSVALNPKGPVLVVSNYVAGLDGLSAQPTLDPSSALTRASVEMARLIPETKEMIPGLDAPPTLVFYPVAQSATLAYRVNLSFTGGEAGTVHIIRYFVIDAHSGAILGAEDPAEHGVFLGR